MSRTLKNASWIIVGKVAQALLAMVVSMLTARYLGPSNYGLINYAASIVAFVIPIMQLGLAEILVQEIVNKPALEGETLGTALIMSFLSSLLSMVCVTVLVLFVNADEKVTIGVCMLYSISLIPQALKMAEYWFQAKLLSKYVAGISFVAYASVSAYKIFLLVSKKSVYWFAISNTLDYLIIAIGLLIIYHKIDGQRLRFSKDRAKAMFNVSKYYIISSMMVTIFAQTDRIMIKLMMNDASTGYYSAAVCYVVAGLMGSPWVALLLSMALACAAFFVLVKLDKKRLAG